MTDYSKLSDDELFAIMNSPEEKAPVSDDIDYSKLSDEELKKIAAGEPTPDEQELDRMMQSKATRYPHEETLPQNIGRTLARTAKDATVGLGGTMADLISLPMLLSGTMKKAPSQEASDYIDEITGGYTKSHNPDERIGSSVVQSLGGIKPSALTGNLLYAAGKNKAGLAAKTARGVGNLFRAGTAPTATNLLSTAGAAGAGQLSAERGGSGVENFVASMLGGAAPGMAMGAGRLAKNPIMTTRKTLADTLGVNPEKAKAHKDAGVKNFTLMDVTDSELAAGAEKGAAHTPFTGKHIKTKHKEKNKELEDLLGFKKGKDTNAAGKDILAHLETVKDNVKKQMDAFDEAIEKVAPKSSKIETKKAIKINGKLEDVIDPKEVNKVMVDISDILEPHNKKIKELDNAEAIADYKKTSAGEMYEQIKKAAETTKKRYEKAFSTQIDEKGNFVSDHRIEKPYLNQEALEYYQKKARGKVKNLFNQIADDEKGALKILTKDAKKAKHDTIAGLSKEAEEIINNQNKFYSDYAQTDKEKINSLFKAKEKGNSNVTEQVYSDLFSNDGNIAKTVLKGANEAEKKQFTQNILSEMAKDGKEFNPKKFAKEYKILKEKPDSYKEAMSGFNETQKKQLDDIVSVIDHSENSLKLAKSLDNPDTKGLNAITGKTGLAIGAVGSGFAYAPMQSITISAIGAITNHIATKGLYTNPKYLNALAEAKNWKSPLQVLTGLNKLEKMGFPVGDYKKSYAKMLRKDAKFGKTSKLTGTALRTSIKAKEKEEEK